MTALFMAQPLDPVILEGKAIAVSLAKEADQATPFAFHSFLRMLYLRAQI